MFWKLPFLFGGPEEKLYALQAAKNFTVNGFFATNGLSNYARIDSEPAIYTHLIDLGAYIIYFFHFLNADFLPLKIFFFLIILANIFIVFKIFTKFVSSSWAFFIAVFNVTTPSFFCLWTELHWPMTLLSVNIAAISLLLIYECRRRLFLFLFLINLIFSSFFSWFAALGILTTSFFVTFLFNKNKIFKQLFFYSFSVFLILVFLKLIWNASYFGFSIELKEILMTLTNRIYGYPSSLDMQEFFNNSGIVIWGAASSSTKILLGYFWQLFTSLLFPLFFIFSAFFFILRSRLMKNKLLILFAAYFGQIGWAIVFPAHMLGYGNMILYISLNTFLLLLVILFSLSLVDFISGKKIPFANNISSYFKSIFFANILNKYRNILVDFLKFTGAVLSSLFLLYLTNINVDFYNKAKKGFAIPAELNQLINHKVIYTNISSIYLSYFADSALISGRCTPDSIIKMSPHYCFNNFEKVSENLVALSNPNYFIFNRDYRSGNTLWSTDKQLDDFQVILDSHLIKDAELIDKGGSIWTIYRFAPK